jgi:hypothetical protein
MKTATRIGLNAFDELDEQVHESDENAIAKPKECEKKVL